MMNKDRSFFYYNSGYIVYTIIPLTCQLHTAFRKVMFKYEGPVVIYEIINPQNYLLLMLDAKILRGLFEYKRLKLTNIGTNERNLQNLAQLEQKRNAGLKI